MAAKFEVRRSIANSFWEHAVLAELVARYSEQGFEVLTDVQFENVRADLVARLQDRVEVVEIKRADAPTENQAAVKQLRNYVRSLPNATFKLVWAVPPREIETEVSGIEDILNQIWVEQVGDTEVADLAAHVMFEAVAGVDLDRLVVTAAGVEVSGSGVAEFELSYGSGEDAFSTPDSYPFSFSLVLDRDLQLEEVQNLAVDVSSFYE